MLSPIASRLLPRAFSKPIPQNPALHPPYRHQVIEAGEEPIPDAVLRAAVHARVMAYRHFRDGKAMHQGQRGKEAMHALEQRQPLHNGAAEQFQRTTGVMDAITSHRIADHEGETRGKLSE